MTVVPRGVEPAQLICDGCGVVITVAAVALNDDELAWPIIADQGWAGSPFVTGPHRCPRCTAEPADVRSEPPLVQRHDLTTSASSQPSWRGVRLRDGEHVVIFRPAGDLVAPVADTVDRALVEALPLGQHLVLDLVDVNVIDPPGLALLVRAHQVIKRRGGLVCLVAPSRFVVTVLHTMRLDGVFPRFDGRADALAWLDTQPGVGAEVRGAEHRNRALATRVRPVDGRDHQVASAG